MRLCGYEIDLLPYREWLSAFRATTDKTNPLHPLRAFFLRSVPDEGDLTLPELYEESRRSMASAGVTDSRLAAAGLECPPLNAKLLDSYFACYVKEAIVPATARHDRGRERPTGIVLPIADALPDITTSLAEQFGDPQLLVGGCRIAPFETDDSIVAELTSWRHGTSTGLFLLEVDLAGGVSTPASTKLVVKAKPSDQHILEVGEAIARLASPELGEAYACFRDDVGFTRSHLRELALFSHPDPRLRRNTPRAHTVVRDDAAERWVIVMERVEGTVRLPSADSDVPWLPGHIDAALRGLAEIHAISYGRENELRTEPWLGPVRDVERVRAMRPLWATLAQHAQKHSAAWRVEGLAAIHDRLVSDVAAWAELPTGPRTLIHNDFNPRNITLRDGGTPGLCAYDWELATIGLPQRDLAEFLAFTLSMDVTPVEVAHWIERYRRLLEHATGAPIDRSQWHAGFRSALGELLVDRLAMYAMVDRFRPQRFLPRVVRTWKRIYEAAI
jgi:aminoglycoside phosphotransferase (APT) family kinase protein